MLRSADMRAKEISVIIGDGISEEITNCTLKVIKRLTPDMEFDIKRAGIEVFEKTGKLLEEGLIESFDKNKVSLKGPIGTPIGEGFRSINVELRKRFDLYANIRPIKTYTEYAKYQDVDIVIFRENTEDLYAGVEEKISDDEMHSVKIITREKSERIARKAYEYALENNRKKVTIVTKANIMKLTDGLFLEVCRKVGEEFSANRNRGKTCGQCGYAACFKSCKLRHNTHSKPIRRYTVRPLRRICGRTRPCLVGKYRRYSRHVRSGARHGPANGGTEHSKPNGAHVFGNNDAQASGLQRRKPENV